ncbi:MAG TPA: hypothetical protein VF266_12440 [Thermoanaerobaculia bacterium]
MNAQTQLSASDLDAILQAAIDAGIAFDTVLTAEERQLFDSYLSDERPLMTPQVAVTPEQREQAESDFATLAVADALMALGAKIKAVLARREEELYQKCLTAYYVAEDLARDPKHAELIPHVESMRAAHERDYGCPIPPRGAH